MLSLTFANANPAEKLPDLEQVPPGLVADTESRLTTTRQALDTEITSFVKDAELFNHKPAKQQTDAEYGILETRRTACIEKAKKFNLEILFYRNLNKPGGDDLAIPDPPLTNDKEHRDASIYQAVIEQFDVEHSKRYKKDTKTYCNVFARDVVHAMGADLPPAKSVNQFVNWLKGDGKIEGWQRIDSRMAAEMANQGRPAIVIWKNPTGPHGHVAMILPDANYDIKHTAPAHGRTEVAQAGSHNWAMIPEDQAFVNVVQKDTIQYWYHQ